MKGKTPEEIREIFHIKNDYTKEEEDEIRRGSLRVIPLYNAISASLVILNIYGPNGCMPFSYGYCLDWMNDIVDTITLATEPRGRQFPFSLP